MNTTQIEASLTKIGKRISQDTFIYDLLLAYGMPKASITRLQSGNLNLSKNEDEILWKKQLFFKVVLEADLHETIDAITSGSEPVKHSPRFIIVTDWETLLAADTRTDEKLDIPIKEIAKYYDFFLPWAGLEKTQHQGDSLADVKAAERMAKLFDEIKKGNPKKSPEFIHSLNVFLSRLLFCFFAEDTSIFGKNQFTNAIGSHTHDDGEDLSQYLDKLFEVLNTENKHRKKLPAFLYAFPYVNGGLFKGGHNAPKFTRRSRKAILDCGELDWSEINPDIFGSMIQAVVRGHEDDDNTKHYTSVPNIMKVIEPLFLNELYEEFEAAKGNNKKLEALLHRIQRIKIFDPACGSGNFLIIAYKELRKLEMKIIKAGDMLSLSSISLSNFYGIELDDFAHEIAMLSLWLAEHQMHMEFFKEFGKANATLPLKQAGYVVHDNAARLDWEKVCPKHKGDEIYILGNPPYAGSRNQEDSQKEDMRSVFQNDYKSLDYVCCWFLKGAAYIEGCDAQFAFVSTNSICQGEQVALIWPRVLSNNLEIGFAHQSFKWSNNAKGKAAVIVIVVGVRNKSNKRKEIYKEKHCSVVSNISAYLTAGKTSYIVRRSKPIFRQLPAIVYGNLINDDGNLVLNEAEKNKLIKSNPHAEIYIKQYIGSKEYLRGVLRYCLYISDEELRNAIKIPEIKKRLDAVTAHRSKSTEESTKAIAPYPNRFYFQSFNNTESIIIPRTSSQSREYIPMGFLSADMIISDAASAVYEASPWVFGIVSSMMHMVWVRAVAGRMKTDYRYSGSICYNTFPFPQISDRKKSEITQHVFRVLGERENHSQKTLAEMYDPEIMPKSLREAHHQLDLAIEGCYRSRPFGSDEERLEYLFNLYDAMLLEETNQDGLFAETEKPAKRKK
jgi:type I restriction-modification system DNA methylase subunit